MKGSARFRYRREVADIGKTDGHPLKETIIQSYNICDLNSEPSNENDEFHSDPKNGQGQLEAQENKDSLKKRKLNKVETVTRKGKEISNVKPSFRSLYPSGSNKWKDVDEKGASSSLSQQELNHRPTSISELGRGSVLILMGCTNCYIYVMVPDDNPKCPKCRKGDCLLDIFRENPVKKDNIM